MALDSSLQLAAGESVLGIAPLGGCSLSLRIEPSGMDNLRCFSNTDSLGGRDELTYPFASRFATKAAPSTEPRFQTFARGLNTEL